MRWTPVSHGVTPQATFKDVRREARSNEREEQLASAEVAACQARTTYPLPPPKVDLVPQSNFQSLKDSLRAELQQDLREQVVLLGKTIAAELRDQLQLQHPEQSPTHRPPPRPRRRQDPRNLQRDERGRLICVSCGEAGHIQWFCPHLPTSSQDFHPARSLQGE